VFFSFVYDISTPTRETLPLLRMSSKTDHVSLKKIKLKKVYIYQKQIMYHIKHMKKIKLKKVHILRKQIMYHIKTHYKKHYKIHHILCVGSLCSPIWSSLPVDWAVYWLSKLSVFLFIYYFLYFNDFFYYLFNGMHSRHFVFIAFWVFFLCRHFFCRYLCVFMTFLCSDLWPHSSFWSRWFDIYSVVHWGMIKTDHVSRQIFMCFSIPFIRP